MASLIEAIAPEPEGISIGETAPHFDNYRFSLPGRCIQAIQCLTWFRVFSAGTRTIHEITRNCTNVFPSCVFVDRFYLASRHLSIKRTAPLVLTAFVCA